MQGMGMVLASVLFGLSIFAIIALGLSTWIIQHHLRDRLGRVYVDLSKLVLHRVVLNCCVSALMTLECMTLFWDNLTTRQFPQAIRWPIDFVLVLLIAWTGIKLFTFYVNVYREMNSGKNTCPHTGLICPVILPRAGTM
jgi:uncharacterized protein YybS (DUF2232 family)